MRPLLAAAITAIALPAGLGAQWHVGIDIAATYYGGTTRPSVDTVPTVKPGADAVLALRVERTFGRLGVALRTAFGKPGVDVSFEDFALVDKTDGRAMEPSVTLTYQLGKVGPSGAVRVEVGPALPLWDIEGEIRYRWAAFGAVAYEWTIAGRFSGAVRAEGLASPSWFEPAELPPELERRTTWRYGVGIGLRYRL